MEYETDSLPAGYGDWANPLEGSDPIDASESRDERALIRHISQSKGQLLQLPKVPWSDPHRHRTALMGGGLRRMVIASVGPRRDDAHYYAPKHVPVGFAAYKSPMLDPSDYTFHWMSGWRVALPRHLCQAAVRDLFNRIHNHGPQSAGYIRMAQTLVPAMLSPGDRQTLAEAGTGFDPFYSSNDPSPYY